MAKVFRHTLITGLFFLAMAGATAVSVVQTQHLSLASSTHNNATANRGDLLIYKNPNAPSGKPVLVNTIPKAGYVLDFLRRPLVLVITIYLPALLIVLYEIKRLARHYTHRTYEAT